MQGHVKFRTLIGPVFRMIELGDIDCQEVNDVNPKYRPQQHIPSLEHISPKS